MSQSTNKIWYAAAAAGALIGVAVLSHYLSQGKSSSSSECFAEIDALGPPKKEGNGMLSFNYYKDIFMIISKHAKQRFADERKDLLMRRRQLLRENKLDEYKELVKTMIQKEE